MENSKIIKLLEYLGFTEDIENIEIKDDETIEINGNEYLVLDDYEADEKFKEYQKNLFDDIGVLTSLTDGAREYVLDNYVDEEWFNDYMRESNQSYIDDIKHEGNRFEEEMSENNCETEEEFLEHLNNNYENGIEWYKDSFGIEAFNSVAKSNNLIDEDKVIDYIKEEDGRGCLASWDGEEMKLGINYFAYQIN